MGGGATKPMTKTQKVVIAVSATAVLAAAGYSVYRYM